MTEIRRPKSKVMVKCFDFSGVLAQLDKDNPGKKYSVNYRWGRVDTHKGPYILCNEGVGSPEPFNDPDKELSLPVCAHFEEDGKKVVGYEQLEITAKELLEVPVHHEESLDIFIRMGGPRLAENFEAWEYHLSRVTV